MCSPYTSCNFLHGVLTCLADAAGAVLGSSTGLAILAGRAGGAAAVHICLVTILDGVSAGWLGCTDVVGAHGRVAVSISRAGLASTAGRAGATPTVHIHLVAVLDAIRAAGRSASACIPDSITQL
jgi:hypothetical protein